MLKVVHSFVDSKRMICFCMICAMLSVALISFGAHATNPQSVDYNVYIKPSLNVSVSSNSVVLNINPAGSLNGSNNPNNFASNNLNVSVATNNQYGYRLYMNSNTSDLVKTDDNTEIIPTLDTTTAESNFPYNKWGYKFSTDTNYQPFQANTNIPISSSDTATNEISTTLNFGAKANYDKKAGTYELDLNFKALPTVTTYYMQDIAKDSTLAESVCTEEPTVVIDKRDEKAYTIRRIGGDGTSANPGDCWMVENLQFTGTTMDSTTSNISPEYTPANPYVATYYDLVTDGTSGSSEKCYTLSTPSGDGFTYSCKHEGEVSSPRSPINSTMPSGTTTHTVWYNYAAATAGTVTGPSNTDPQVYDICPSGWRLPNKTEAEIIGNGTLDNADPFSPTLGGVYGNGTIYGADTQAAWWTSTVSDHTYGRYYLIASNSGIIVSKASDSRGLGNYVRCIMNQSVGSVTTLQQLGALSTSEKTAIKNSMATNKGYVLKDTRDDQLYTIAKINDGEVYMVDNLSLGAIALKGDLTNTNTNLSTTVTKSVFESWYRTGTSPTATYTDGTFVYIPGIDTTSETSYGTLYNYCAASAKTICTNTTNPDATADLCPSGWRMPTGGEGGEYQTMYNTGYTITSVHDSLANGGAAFAWTGEVGSDATYYAPGTEGLYWTATADNTSGGYLGASFKFFTLSDSAFPVNHSARNRMHAIRCRLK